jgi:hypothetical protein
MSYLNGMKETEIFIVKWEDSYGAVSGWQDIDTLPIPEVLECVSVGIKVYENKKVVALAPNFANSTTYTPKQGNGLMVIPKSCITGITSFWLKKGVESKQKRLRF